MARTNPYGYYFASTNKYGWSTLYPGEGPWYGGRQGGDPAVEPWHMYGLNYPPPVPENFTIEYWPVTSDPTPIYYWTAADPEGASLIFTIEMNYAVDDFTSPTITLPSFVAGTYTGGWWYELPMANILVNEGFYYARIKSSDGFTWSDWSDTLQFEFTKAPPPPPTIDPVTSPTDNFVQQICGTKVPDAHVFIRNNGGEWEEASYPYGLSGGRWCYTMTLVSGINYIEAIASWSESTVYGVSGPAVATIHTIFNSPEIYNVWNAFDEMGMLVTLDRIRGEKNKAYKKRILDVYENPGNSTYAGLINAISREIGIDASGVAVYRLSDLADPDASGNILNEDGNAIGTKLVTYTDEVYSHNPIFWGNLVSDEGIWDAIDEDYSGLSYLPHLWDPSASGIYPKWQNTGIGDQDDLWVNEPIKILDPSGAVYGVPTGSGMMQASGVLRDDDEWRLPVHSGYFYAFNPGDTLLGWGYSPWGEWFWGS